MNTTIKNHLLNESTGKTHCGLTIGMNSHLAVFEDGIWYDSYSNPIGAGNWKGVFCFNCLKYHDLNLIAEFNAETFFAEYKKQLPKSIRAARLKNASIRLNRAGKKTVRSYQSVSSQLADADKKEEQSKPIKKKKKVKPIESKPVESKPIKQSEKAKRRKERKLNHQLKKRKELKNSIDKIASKYPIKEKQSKPKAKKTIDIIETVSNADNWKFGDPIKDKSICELQLNSEYKLVRGKHDTWQFIRIETKGKKTIQYVESDFLPYSEAVELANELIFV